jgi:hypothetical protein
MVVAGIIGVMLASVAVYLWRRDTFDGRRIPLADLPFVLVAAPGVGDDDIRIVEDGLRIADDYLRGQLGSGVSRRVEVRLAHNKGCQRGMPPVGSSTAWALPEMLCVNTRSDGWRADVGRDPDDAAGVVAHEHIHNLQGQTGCFPQPGEHRWLWLFEGMAEEVSFRALIAAGRRTENDLLDRVRRMRVADPTLGPLSGFERSGAERGDPAYALFHLAVHRLTQWSAGPRALLDFCGRVAGGTAWTAAFEDAFGLPLSRFYQRFEEDRRTFITAA